jgi:hypothetical protein
MPKLTQDQERQACEILINLGWLETEQAVHSAVKMGSASGRFIALVPVAPSLAIFKGDQDREVRCYRGLGKRRASGADQLRIRASLPR